jgi:hypothetical protein
VALTNHQRVGQGLQELASGLRPFVERELRARFGDEWLERGLPRSSRGPTSPDDPGVLLRLLSGNWNEVFAAKLSRVDRNYVYESVDVRNRWAHHEVFSTDDALRALDTFHRLLQAVAAGEQANSVDRMRQELLRAKFDEQARRTSGTSGRRAPDLDPTASGLPGWRQVAEPHDDVATGRFELAQFAADLHQVWRGEAASEYGDPQEFFRRTYLTAGLRELLLNALRRFHGVGGDPVVKLQTNFGGGKTHALIALYHLASGTPATELPGVEEMLADSGLSLPPGPVRRAVLVGQQLQPSSVSHKPDGTQVHTIWGELAWQLGGADGYALVAEADRVGVNPGEALSVLLRRCAPCLVLIDEWVAYARNLYGVSGLPAGSFDAQFSFAQAITDAARAEPRALLLVSIPASDIEVGGEGGRAALQRLEHVIGRMEATWRTATTEESYEIVRRRLFKPLAADAARQRDAVVRAFGELYAGAHGEFPAECKEAEYTRRMRAAYPIHPELFDRLFGDWSELDRFQRTRGVLRLMAKVIHALWMAEDPSLLIMPGTIPIADKEVAEELTRYLDEPWTPVIETDVDGPNSLPYHLDREHGSTFGRIAAARRVARTIYFGSAPSQHAANKGLDDRHVKLGCVQPGERSPVFGDALRRLAERATYLYRDSVRYWYGPTPTVSRLAQDRAAAVRSDEVDEEIRQRLDPLKRHPGVFGGVHTAPRVPGDVPDDDVARLVVLGPEHPHDPKAEPSLARGFAERVLSERAGGARRCRNMLVFAAPDAGGLDACRQAVREWIAWASIERDRESLNLDVAQTRVMEQRLREADETVNLRVADAYRWVLNPGQSRDEPTGPVTWDVLRVSGSDPLPERVAKKLLAGEALIPAYSGSRLRLDIERVPLWRDDGERVSVDQLWDDISQYLYLPRLAQRSVLEAAIEDGVARTTWDTDGFAYADGFAEGRYVGLVAGSRPAAVAPSGLVVNSAAARRQLDIEERRPHTERETLTPREPSDDASPPDAAARLPTRYYGRITLETLRWRKAVADIADAIVDQLEQRAAAKVRITIEIEAESEGFDDALQRTIVENATTLKFTITDFSDR